MLTALISLMGAISPIHAAPPLLNAPLILAERRGPPDDIAGLFEPPSAAEVAAVEVDPVEPRLPEWAARLEPNPKARYAEDPDERLRLVEVYYRRGQRAQALNALKEIKLGVETQGWLDWAVELRAWPLALARIKAAPLPLEDRVSALSDLAERMYDEGERARLDGVVEAIAAARYSAAEDKEWARGWAEEPKARPPAEERLSRAEDKAQLISEALATLASLQAEREPARAVQIARLTKDPDTQREIVNSLLEFQHLEAAAALAKRVEDVLYDEPNAEDAEPNLAGTEARVEVLLVALDLGEWRMAWAMLKALKDPGGEAFEEHHYEALTAMLPHAIRRNQLPALLKAASQRLRGTHDLWEQDVIRALIEQEQILPAMARIKRLKDQEARADLAAQLTEAMKRLGLRVDPSQIKSLTR